MKKEKGFYSDKPLYQRLLFFTAGLTNFIIGYTLYYLFKDDKTKKWQIEFIQRGAAFGLIITILGIAFQLVDIFMK